MPGVTGLGAASRVGAKAVNSAATGAENAVNGLKLNKSLASQSQMGETGSIIAATGTRAPV